MPLTSWSGGLLSSVADLFQASPGSETTNDSSTETASAGERYGTTDEIGSAIEALSMKYVFAEDISGGSEEAKLCLKKGGPGLWGVCEDYRNLVREFVQRERARRESSHGLQQEGKLAIDVFFAESDMMIGKAGQRYFEECWRQEGVEDVVDLKVKEVPGTNHETVIIDVRKGAMGRIFEKAAARRM